MQSSNSPKVTLDELREQIASAVAAVKAYELPATCVRFYNRSRRHSTLGCSSPVRFLENWISGHVDRQSEAA